MKRFTILAALIITVLTQFVAQPLPAKADDDTQIIICEVQTSEIGTVIYCRDAADGADAVPVQVSSLPDCPVINTVVVQVPQPFTWSDAFYTFACKDHVAPEIPQAVTDWAKSAKLGDKMSYAGISWEIEDTTLVAYDFKPDGEISLNVRRWLLSDLRQKLESTDYPRE